MINNFLFKNENIFENHLHVDFGEELCKLDIGTEDSSYKLNFIENLFQLAIECNFRYTEDDKDYPEHLIKSLVDRSAPTKSPSVDSKEFVCQDEILDDGNVNVNKNETNYSMLLSDRVSLGETTTLKASPVDDDAEAESLCCSKRKTIRPKTLPSVVDNKLVYVVNHGDFSQTVTIEECT